jgi:hypothetical protein
MKKLTVILICLLPGTALFAQSGAGEKLPVKWEELIAPKFVQAVEQSGGVCIIPLGVYEKHGIHLPLGELQIQSRADKVAELISYMKSENSLREIMDEFYEKSENPVRTKPFE